MIRWDFWKCVLQDSRDSKDKWFIRRQCNSFRVGVLGDTDHEMEKLKPLTRIFIAFLNLFFKLLIRIKPHINFKNDHLRLYDIVNNLLKI